MFKAIEYTTGVICLCFLLGLAYTGGSFVSTWQNMTYMNGTETCING